MSCISTTGYRIVLKFMRRLYPTPRGPHQRRVPRVEEIQQEPYPAHCGPSENPVESGKQLFRILDSAKASIPASTREACDLAVGPRKMAVLPDHQGCTPGSQGWVSTRAHILPWAPDPVHLSGFPCWVLNPGTLSWQAESHTARQQPGLLSRAAARERLPVWHQVPLHALPAGRPRTPSFLSVSVLGHGSQARLGYLNIYRYLDVEVTLPFQLVTP